MQPSFRYVVLSALFISVISVLSIIFFPYFVSLVSAQGHDGDSSLCGRKWTSERQSSSPNGVEMSNRQISECSVIQPGTLNSSDPKLATFLAEVKKDLWDSRRLPQNTLYRYTFRVINDWDKDADYNFSDWEVVHSPYTRIQKSFILRLPACSVATIQFLSPWAPEAHTSPVNVGYDENSKGWSIMGTGMATILTPVWFQYYQEEFKIEKLSSSEAKTKACSSP